MFLKKHEKRFLALCKELYISGNYEFESFEDSRYIAVNSEKTYNFMTSYGIDSMERIAENIFLNIFEHVYDVSENRDKYFSDLVAECLIYDNILQLPIYLKCAIYRNRLYIIMHVEGC